MKVLVAKHTETMQDVAVFMLDGIRGFVVDINNIKLLKELEQYPSYKPVPDKDSYCKHYKGGVYHLIATVVSASTGELLVFYCGTDGNYWVRPEEMFFGHVVFNGNRVPRFRKINL